MYADALSLYGIETGLDPVSTAALIKEGADVANAAIDWAAGGPQKRVREARANRDAALAIRDAAALEVEAARIAAASAAAQQPGGLYPVPAAAGSNKLMQIAKHEVVGVPVWQWLIGGVATWAVLS